MPTTSHQPQHAVLRVEYDGTPFRGWTRQPGGLTIEDELLEAFARLRCEGVRLRCAGRTDAGVHAVAQVVDARYVGRLEPAWLTRALAGQLPPQIAVVASMRADPGFDARADATSRTYEYRVLTRPVHSPVRAGRVLHHPRPLDLDALQQCARAALGQHDFRAFTPSRTEHVFFERTIATSRWEERGDELVYVVQADAFLRHMVRVLVGTMLPVGRGDWPLERFVDLLDGAPRSDARETAPPHGLCLTDVTWEPVAGLALPPGWRAARHAAAGAAPAGVAPSAGASQPPGVVQQVDASFAEAPE